MSKRVLITGGSGFIGSNLALDLKAKNYDVLLVDCVQPLIHELQADWVSVDLMDNEALQRSVADFKPNLAVHLAAITDLDGKDSEYYEMNIKGTRNLIQACSNVGGVEKFIFTSSMLVCKSGYIPANDEDYCPDTLYGESKMEMEKMIREECRDLNWTIVRPSSIWGPWFKQPYRTFFDMVIKGQYLDMGKFSCTKTYGYIGNVTFQLEQLMNSKKAIRNTYYLGDKPAIFISEWAQEITGQLKKGNPIKLPFFMFKIAGWIGDLLGGMGISFPVTSFRIKNMTTDNILPLDNLYELAGEPPYSRKEGIVLTLEWMAANKG